MRLSIWISTPRSRTAAIAAAMVALLLGCDTVIVPPDATGQSGQLELVARLAHVTDTQLVDEQSPARLANTAVLVSAAWRPHEAYSTQLFDGIIRTINRIHASGRSIDFVLHTGDACDNAQHNELGWFVDVFDGTEIDPMSGPDDRHPNQIPNPHLDPHAPFEPQGVYRRGEHGSKSSVPWYVVFGNHDAYAVGVFPIIEVTDGLRVAPMPLEFRPASLLPVLLDPAGSLTYSLVTPANPGPPQLLDLPVPVTANLDRAYYTRREFINAMFRTETGPPGHGFDHPGQSWYSTSPVAGLRLIGLDTSDVPYPVPGLVYHEGGMSAVQIVFLIDQLIRAYDRNELVIVASHHPTNSFNVPYTNDLMGDYLPSLLKLFPNVILHLAGHTHVNRVTNHGSYLEIETSAVIDLPQQGRLIEIWREPADGAILIQYEMFSGLDDDLPDLGSDPLRSMRRTALSKAMAGHISRTGQQLTQPTDAPAAGTEQDRQGEVLIALE